MLDNVNANAGSFALRDVTFTLGQGKYGVLMGPAGAGKTTLLEAVAGLGTLASGTIELNGYDMSGVPPEQRDVALVYQHSYLFPHLSAGSNVEYGAASTALARDLAERLGVWALRDRAVQTLSGGERQLVALVRALARRPRILLLDEPFAALDPGRRARVRRVLRDIHREWHMTTLQVTHDFAEARLLGDVAVLLDGGRIVQTGAPGEVFRRPASPAVAEFLGAENLLVGRLQCGGQLVVHAAGRERFLLHAASADGEGSAHAVVAPEEIALSLEPSAIRAPNQLRGRILELAANGAQLHITLDAGGINLVAAIAPRSAREMGLSEGVEVYASFGALDVVIGIDAPPGEWAGQALL